MDLVLILLAIVSISNLALSDFNCVRRKGEHICEILSDEEKAAATNVESVNNDYCLFLQHGQEDQICNYKKANTDCYLNCSGPFCVKANALNGIVAKLSTACWLEQSDELLNQNFGYKEVQWWTVINSNICKNLHLNRFYHHPCNDEETAKNMESADAERKVCASFQRDSREFESEQDMLIYNCVRNTTYAIVDDSVCNSIDYDYNDLN